MQTGNSAFFSALWQDVRFGARILWRSPIVTAVILLTLALGIGANSAMFSVIDAALLHPLAYEDPDSLDLIFDRDMLGQLRPTSAGNFSDWRRARSYSGLAAWAPSLYVIGGLEKPLEVPGGRVTANIFDVLGVKPLLGRSFIADEDGMDGRRTARKVVIISYALWRDAMGLDPNVLGRSIRLNDVPYDIVGVMPADFEVLNRTHRLWVPAEIDATNRDSRYLNIIGRRIVPKAEAAAEMLSISRTLAQSFPDANQGWTTQAMGFEEWLIDRRIRTRLLLLFAAVGMVLLLACSNVASLLLARAAGRSREIALRAALGASRGRIVRQLLVESLTLSLLGGLGGLSLAALLIRIAPSYIPPSTIQTTAPLDVSPTVIGFTLGVSLLTGLLFGLAPAFGASRPDVQEVLQDAARGSTGGRGRQLFRQAMVTVQVAVALALLSGAGLMARSLQRMAERDFGVRVDHVLTQRIFLPFTSYKADQSLRFHRQVLEQVATLPGVKEAAMGSNLPLAGLSVEIGFDKESNPVQVLADMYSAGYTTATPGYFHLLGIPVLAGREFADTDSENAPGVAIINNTLAKRYFPNGEAVGQRIRVVRPILGSNNFGDIERLQIVGVVGDIPLHEPGLPPAGILYAPMAQHVWSTASFLAVRTSSDPAGIAAGVRDVILKLDPNLPLDPASSLEQSLAAQFAEPQFQSRLMSGFSLLAFILAVVGIYSVNAYAVTQRTREIGVRLALGATPGGILMDVVSRGMKVTAAGIVLGLFGAAAVNSLLSSALVDVAATEVGPIAVAAGLMIIAAAIACFIPAWRATRIDPAITLRRE